MLASNDTNNILNIVKGRESCIFKWTTYRYSIAWHDITDIVSSKSFQFGCSPSDKGEIWNYFESLSIWWNENDQNEYDTINLDRQTFKWTVEIKIQFKVISIALIYFNIGPLSHMYRLNLIYSSSYKQLLIALQIGIKTSSQRRNKR